MDGRWRWLLIGAFGFGPKQMQAAPAWQAGTEQFKALVICAGHCKPLQMTNDKFLMTNDGCLIPDKVTNCTAEGDLIHFYCPAVMVILKVKQGNDHNETVVTGCVI